MVNVIIVIAVVLLVVLAVYIQVRNKKNGGSSCGCGGSSSGCGGCGSSGGCDTTTEVKPVSKAGEGAQKTLELDIEGMHCGKCQNSVSEALNSLDGVSATVDLEKKCATVVLSKEVPEADLKQAVSDKGFEVTAVRTM